MKPTSLADLQASVQDRFAFSRLEDYFTLGCEFLRLIDRMQPTRIISPSHANYIFYQYSAAYRNRITRPLNVNLFIEEAEELVGASERFVSFLDDLKHHKAAIATRRASRKYIASKEINKVIYTLQQAIGSIGDSFENANQCRKRVGQLFENLVKLVIQQIGLVCEPRTVNIPIAGYSDRKMSYELDVVFTRSKVVVAAETHFIHPSEVVGSVKTTSKDRIDKIFLDKFLLTKLLGRDIPVVAIFLHDVQRANKGNSIFGINSTFKSNHFLGYTVALNRLDGVYYVDPRPEMFDNERLREQISDFQAFLVNDLWTLSNR